MDITHLRYHTAMIYCQDNNTLGAMKNAQCVKEFYCGHSRRLEMIIGTIKSAAF